VDLDVEEGSFVSLVGPSGSGKSSLLRAVIGLQQPLAGSVETGVARSQLGILFQDDALLPWKTARDNVALGLGFAGEFVAASRGLGYLLSFAQSTYNAALMFALILLILAVVLVIFGIAGKLERYLLRWN
jgi:ABC-type sugar transport system ATPase subunit